MTISHFCHCHCEICEWFNFEFFIYFCELRKNMYNITMTSQGARRRLNSPSSRVFIQPFIQAQSKENIKAPRHWSLCREFTAENVSLWWRHHKSFMHCITHHSDSHTNHVIILYNISPVPVTYICKTKMCYVMRRQNTHELYVFSLKIVDFETHVRTKWHLRCLWDYAKSRGISDFKWNSVIRVHNIAGIATIFTPLVELQRYGCYL